MILALSIGLVVVVLLYVLVIRPQDLPFVEPHSPTGHLDERKAAIYENLRDANFEFLMGKLSPDDYQATKADLQQELNAVNVEIQTVASKLDSGKAKAAAPKSSNAKAQAPTSTPAVSESVAGTQRFVCGNCGASFPLPLKFCGECGSKMDEARA
ncbi:MAG: hypothetical protein KIT83_14180 [Bryobacterales bacterium]|nr:hypothetical protein [Bryobacterales bacterium]